MSALHVVGDDFHGGHDRHACLIAHQERAAQLVRVCLLRNLLRKDFSGDAWGRGTKAEHAQGGNRQSIFESVCYLRS